MKRLTTICLCFFLLFNMSCFANINPPEATNTQSCVLDISSNQVIYGKKPHEKGFPASTTKIMTILLALESGIPLNQVITVSRESFNDKLQSEDAQIFLFEDEEIKFIDLLYAAAIASANDACYVIANTVANSEEAFVEMMNKRAKQIGANDTHFVTCNGMHDKNHYSSPYDMCLIIKEACKNETFVKLMSTTSYIIGPTNKQAESRPLSLNDGKSQHNLLNSSMYYMEEMIATKTGYTDEAKCTQISMIRKDGKDYAVCIFGASNGNLRFGETKQLFEYAYDHYELLRISQNYEEPIFNLPIFTALKNTDDYYSIEPIEQLYVYNDLIDYPLTRVFIPVPLSKNSEIGDLAGYYAYKQNNEIIYQQPVYLNSKIKTHISLKDILLSLFYGIVSVVVVLLMLALIIRNVMKFIRRKFRRRR